MSEFCEHETFKDICGICHRDTQITALRAEVERLTGERDRQYDQNAEQIIRIAALEAENERLKGFEAANRLNAAQVKAQRAEVERLRAALRNCIGLLDGLVAESGRSIEWGEEDPFRMGEWFEVEDLEQIKEARAALAAPSGALEEKQ